MCALLVAVWLAPAHGQEESVQPTALPPLVVGVKHSPPFAFKRDDGTWSGLSIELWESVAKEIGRDWVYEEHALAELLVVVEKGDVDLGVAALTVTADRERRFDFGQPFHTSGLGIAVVPDPEPGLIALLFGIISGPFFEAVAALAGLLFSVGVIVWLFERRTNEQFGGSASEGLFAGFWWSAATMTTVGYGDKVPRSVGGRIVGIVWMFTSILIISSFTAAIASALTAHQLELPLDGPEDLHTVKVGTVNGSTSADWLDEHDLAWQSYDDLGDAMGALDSGALEAVVYDAPVLAWVANNQFDDRIAVLPRTFERQDYAIAFPDESPLRESVDIQVLEQTSQPWWGRRLREYLGE